MLERLDYLITGHLAHWAFHEVVLVFKETRYLNVTRSTARCALNVSFHGVFMLTLVIPT